MVLPPLVLPAFAMWLRRGRPGARVVGVLALGLIALAARVPLSGYTISDSKQDSPFLLGVYRLEHAIGSANGSLAIAVVAALLSLLAVGIAWRSRLAVLAIGLSLIFQFYLTRFAELVRTLREGGVACHLTIGGHFPSLSWQPTLEMIPELDSVVRFEGEVTLLELADMLSTGGEWRGIAGMASCFGVAMAHHEEPQVALHLLAGVAHGLCVEFFPNWAQLTGPS